MKRERMVEKTTADHLPECCAVCPDHTESFLLAPVCVPMVRACVLETYDTERPEWCPLTKRKEESNGRKIGTKGKA